MLNQVLLIAFAYLLGSISSAIITCKLFRLPDPRTEGSNNPGATNVMRIGGKLPAIITLLGDSLKGLIPTLIATLTNQPPTIITATMLAAFIGHIFPIFFQFKGGKGVATFIGGLIVVSWQTSLIFLCTWGVVFWVSRISALSALIASAITPIIIYFILGQTPAILFTIMVIVILYKHKENIKRIVSGSENKFK